MKKSYSKKSIIILLICCVHVTIAQIVEIRNENFYDTEKEEIFYPIVQNYQAYPYGINNNNDIIIGPNSFYGSDPYSLECDLVNKNCNNALLTDFNRIRAMNFNTLRLTEAAQYYFDPVDKKYYFTSAFQNLEQTSSQKVYFTKPYNNPNGWAMKYANAFRKTLDIAHAADLKIILIAGGSYVNLNTNISPKSEWAWESMSDQAAQDYADYLEFLASELGGHPALMAFDLYNEPGYGILHLDKNFEPLPKSKICQYMDMWYNAIKNGSSDILVTIGAETYGASAHYDATMKMDFYSLHPYPIVNFGEIERLGQDEGYENAFSRSLVTMYWASKTVHIPWIIGETGFTANETTNFNAIDPNLSNAQKYHEPPFMFGTEQQQKDYAQQSLDYTINCGGKGYSWWIFQDVIFFGQDDNRPDLWSGNNYGTLALSDGSNQWANYKKPMAEVFENFNQSTIANPSLCTTPKVYYEPPYNQLGEIYNGRAIDRYGQPLANVYIFAHIEFVPRGTSTKQFETQSFYGTETFTDANGFFKISKVKFPPPSNYNQSLITSPTDYQEVHFLQQVHYMTIAYPGANTKDFKDRVELDALTSNIFTMGVVAGFAPSTDNITITQTSQNGGIKKAHARNSIYITNYQATNGSHSNIIAGKEIIIERNMLIEAGSTALFNVANNEYQCENIQP